MYIAVGIHTTGAFMRNTPKLTMKSNNNTIQISLNTTAPGVLLKPKMKVVFFNTRDLTRDIQCHNIINHGNAIHSAIINILLKVNFFMT